MDTKTDNSMTGALRASDPSTKTVKALKRGNQSSMTGVGVLSYTFLRREVISQHKLLARLSDSHTGIGGQGTGCVATDTCFCINSLPRVKILEPRSLLTKES